MAQVFSHMTLELATVTFATSGALVFCAAMTEIHRLLPLVVKHFAD
jgi:hypothetical protein